jgi:release factor glutamine methyltransferase
LVALALEIVQDLERTASVSSTTSKLQLADLCSGSGAIALALAQNLQLEANHAVTAQIVAVERFPDAFAYLKRNCARYSKGVVLPMLGDAAQISLPTCDVVVMNPPYIPAEIELPADLGAEPSAALYGLGKDGFEIPRAIIKNAAEHLKSGGHILVEHFEAQNWAAREALEKCGFSGVQHIQDLNHRPRFTIAVKI